jgi:DNA polymerase III, epsilon subunit and related 3''-5'' exonucleases
MTTLVGLDFEMANPIVGSLCAYGLAYEDGTVESGVLALHPTKGGRQERQRFHGISPAETAAGFGPQALYRRLLALPSDAVLVAHDARIDRTHLYAWLDMWGLPLLDFRWFDTLRIARREFGKQGKTGVAAMAERMGLTVKAHDPADDARVALEIATRFEWGQFRVLDNPIGVL